MEKTTKPSQGQAGTVSDASASKPSQEQAGLVNDACPPKTSFQGQAGTVSDAGPLKTSQEQADSVTDAGPPKISQEQAGPVTAADTDNASTSSAIQGGLLDSPSIPQTSTSDRERTTLEVPATGPIFKFQSTDTETTHRATGFTLPATQIPDFVFGDGFAGLKSTLPTANHNSAIEIPGTDIPEKEKDQDKPHLEGGPDGALWNVGPPTDPSLGRLRVPNNKDDGM